MTAELRKDSPDSLSWRIGIVEWVNGEELADVGSMVACGCLCDLTVDIGESATTVN